MIAYVLGLGTAVGVVVVAAVVYAVHLRIEATS